MTLQPPHVILNREPLFTLGPLGYWAVGDEPLLPDGRRVVVVALDPDGGAVSFLFDHIDRLAFDRNVERQRIIDGLKHVRTSYPLSAVTPAQQQQCHNIVAAGIRRRQQDEAA